MTQTQNLEIHFYFIIKLGLGNKIKPKTGEVWDEAGVWLYKTVMGKGIWSFSKVVSLHKATGGLWGKDWARKVISPLGSQSWKLLLYWLIQLWVFGNHWAKSETHLALINESHMIHLSNWTAHTLCRLEGKHNPVALLSLPPPTPTSLHLVVQLLC